MKTLFSLIRYTIARLFVSRAIDDIEASDNVLRSVSVGANPQNAIREAELLTGFAELWASIAFAIYPEGDSEDA